MEIRGYETLVELVRSGPFSIRRGRRLRDRQSVLFKVPTGAPPGASDVDALQREFEVMRDVAIPGVPRAYEVVRVGDLACLVLEDRGLGPLRSAWDATRADLATALRLTIQLCTTLSQLHARGVTCGSVNPASVLVGTDFNDAQLVDFTLASRSTAEKRALAAVVAGAAAVYASPEQTGRINRAIDYRTDLYSLGATLYELLTGRPPFSSDDPLELIHAHIAKAPASPSALVPTIPDQVSRIVLRLLAKGAEDRYQSALGLKHDLERCVREWDGERHIASFELGERDVADRFLIPQRLYGRDREVATLMQAFEETCEAGAALMLVSGYSGIGKTSLISELYKPIVRARGAFISGKFDQVAGNVPYGALIQAFRALMWQLLAESEERLARWRVALSDALGNNGGVLAEVIPEIEVILGRQQPPPPLDPAAAQNRFRYVFQCFVGALARKDHPLVLFLDDLQWVDPGTLDVLHELLTSPGIGHFLVIGAYRDNEVGPEHPLTRAASRLDTSDARVHRVWLGALALPDIVHFLCDTLHTHPGAAEPLAQLILRKTDGNPFFVIQFLKALHQEGLFEFDYARARWSFRTDAIAAAPITDNVVDLMTRRIRALSPSAQDVVTMAACIGSAFESSTVLTVCRQSSELAMTGLAEAVNSGLIQPGHAVHGPSDRASRGTAYAFLHDRVQQAAYSLIPEHRRGPVHLDVGRLLWHECGADVPEDRLFEIVNHLNTGRSLISDPAERAEVARLNLAAGRKAKTSAAYEAAASYLDAGCDLLPEEYWDRDYELMFPLHLEAAECHYLARLFDKAERYFERLLTRARTSLDKAQVYRSRIVLYENLSHYRQAMASGLEGLRLFGIVLPERETEASPTLDLEIDAIQRLLGGRAIASLVGLPVMTNDDVRMVMRILTALWSPAYIAGNQLLARLISATLVRLSLEHGNTEDSAYGYVTHAITIGPIRGDFRSAYEWGELALAVNERFDDALRRAKIHQQFHAHVKLWRRSFASCIPHAREARRSGLEAGDLNYAGYGAVTETWAALPISNDLNRFVEEYEPAATLLERLKLADFLAALRVMLNWARALQGRTVDRLSLSDADFDEAAFVARFEHEPFFRTFFYTAKLQLCVLLGESEQALDAARRAREGTLTGTIWPVLVDFWGGLALASAFPAATDSDRAHYWRELVAAQRSLEVLADNCAENFRCFSLMLSAEIKRITSQPAAAAALCDEAIAYARQTDNLQHEALANELCARAWLARGDEHKATPFLREAHRAYSAWGASTKVEQLERKHGNLLATQPPARATEPPHAVMLVSSSTPESASLDMATVLKVARAIAVEIELEGLCRKLMKIALENAGAERGTFLQDENGQLVVRAEAVADPEQVQVRPSMPWEQAEHLAHSVVRYVRRTGEDVVVSDAATDPRFAADPYIMRTAARSILCVPVGHQGRMGGVLYLENNLTAGAFTPQRTETMRVLAAQAAISLETARLYEGMRMEVERRTVAERGLRDALAELQTLKNRLEAENVYLQEEIRTQHNFEEIVGNSPALLDALHKVERVAPTESTVLILGETGSGKELFARAVHSRSPRSQRPLVKVNCGAIAPGLVESELFGHVKGAFTGAIDKRVGRFELANGGTILLDEVGELPLDAQVKLLRVLQEQEFEPVGSSRTVRVDVRVIAATNRNLEDAVREGRLRADLLYRLNVFPIVVPPLRERAGDVRLLIGFCVTGLARKLGKPIHGFSASSMERLMQYAWPGNVRELQNVVERAAILAQGPVLEIDGGMLGGTTTQGHELTHSPDAATLERVQREHILDVLRRTGGVVEGAKGAATILGLHPNTLRSRMRKLGISPSSRSAS
jgi:predicted ATPase/transcriptional regulator with GAF, ATPase, and Fis domain